MGMGVIQIMNTVFALIILIVGCYGVVLFVKLARRCIKALDIYIDKNRYSDMRDKKEA